MAMQIHWTTDGCDEKDEYRIEQFWKENSLELGGKISCLEHEPAELRLAIHRHDEEPQWEVQAALHAYPHTLVAETTDRTLQQALDTVVHELAGQIDQAEERPEEVTLQSSGGEAILPLLERSREMRRSRAFMSFLSPLVASLAPYVQRELELREIEQRLKRDQLAVSDVLDELIVRAWEGFPQRDASIRLWLLKLVEEVLAEHERPFAEESLDDEQEMPSREVRESRRDEWLEQIDTEEMVSVGELLPDGEHAGDWDELESELKHTQLYPILARLPRDQRQALLLHIADGFSPAEIADFQDRPAADVSDDIAKARGILERELREREWEDIAEGLQRTSQRSRKR